jgi:beta-lactamase superfamily II metal-dependent hydrolase
LPINFGTGRTGTLLCGDIKFNQDNLNQIQSKWAMPKYIESVSFFQIPHHGANHYIDPTVVRFYQNVRWWIINFGLGNKYRHPRQEIVDLIMNHKNRGDIFCNTQSSDFRYGFILLRR